MILFSRLLPRVPLAARRLTTFAPAAIRPCFLPIIHRAPNIRSVHIDTSQVESSSEQLPAGKTSIDPLPTSRVSPLEADIDSDWRHPRFGFTAEETPHFIFINLPRIATEDDVKALLARAGLDTAQIFMDYSSETGKPGDRCFLRIADKERVHDATLALSRYTLLGSPLRPKKYDLGKVHPANLHDIYAGWLPSPTSHLMSRVFRPPTTSPPKLVAPLMNEQWVVCKHLEALHPYLKSNARSAQAMARSNVAHDFYNSFHHYDVVGISVPYLHNNKTNGWCCKILFGNRKDAQEAAKLWRNKFEKTSQGTANIFRGGPDIHKKLWDYRRSLPEDIPEEEIAVFLEMKYRELRTVTDADHQRRLDHPTPESAVGLSE